MASIRKRGKSYQITVSNGRDIHDKQILETATWTPDPNKTEKQNQKALERFVMDFEEKAKNGRYLDGEKITFEDFTARWLDEYASMQLEPTTVDVYRLLLNTHTTPAIGHLKLAKVQPDHQSRDILSCSIMFSSNCPYSTAYGVGKPLRCFGQILIWKTKRSA